MKLPSSNIRKFLVFPQKKVFLVFKETGNPENFPLYCRKQKPEKILYTSGNKTFLYFMKRKP